MTSRFLDAISRTNLQRRHFLGAALIALSGCTPITLRPQSPDDVRIENDEGRQADYIGDVSGTWGLDYLKVEGVSLVTRLDGTGSDPSPSSMRTELLDEMRHRNVESPNRLLADPETSMVMVRGFLPPGIQKGERYDIEVRVPSRSTTTSLSGGYLLPARLRPLAVLGNSVRSGHVKSAAKGPVIVDSVFEPGDEALQVKGTVFGGGIALHSRPFGLVIRSNLPTDNSGDALSQAINRTKAAALIARAINRRFHTNEYGNKKGVANPQSDKVIELVVAPQYKNNLGRFIKVVRNIAFREQDFERIQRLEQLERELNEPFFSARAALRLEGIGVEAIPILQRGAESNDLEIRFYSAEALAYLGDPIAAPILADVAFEEPAFRWHCMAALASMDHVEAGVALSRLLDSRSAETRYGAFRSMLTRSPYDPLVRGTEMKGNYYYHVVPSSGPPMIHFSRSRRPEIVLFGAEQRVGDDFLFVDKGLTIKSIGNGQVQISRFSARHGDHQETCSNQLDQIIRSIDKLGAHYGAILNMVKSAAEQNSLQSRLVINAVPRPGKKYHRDAGNDTQSGEGTNRFMVGPLPSLFRDDFGGSEQRFRPRPTEPVVDPVDERKPKKGIWGRFASWFAS